MVKADGTQTVNLNDSSSFFNSKLSHTPRKFVKDIMQSESEFNSEGWSVSSHSQAKRLRQKNKEGDSSYSLDSSVFHPKQPKGESSYTESSLSASRN